MPTDHPNIDLRGYQRLRDLEQQVSWSPLVIVLAVIACVGLGVLVYGQYAFLQNVDYGFATLLTGVLLIIAAVGGLAGYFTWRLSRIKCPHCARNLRPYVTDLTDGNRGCCFPGFEIDGRYYSQPFGDDHDERPWVRLNKVVRACESCRTYLDCSQYHQATCLEEDLERIRQRLPNHERDMRRRESWGKALALLWGVFLLVAFLLLWWSNCG